MCRPWGRVGDRKEECEMVLREDGVGGFFVCLMLPGGGPGAKRFEVRAWVEVWVRK